MVSKRNADTLVRIAGESKIHTLNGYKLSFELMRKHARSKCADASLLRAGLRHKFSTLYFNYQSLFSQRTFFAKILSMLRAYSDKRVCVSECQNFENKAMIKSVKVIPAEIRQNWQNALITNACKYTSHVVKPAIKIT